MHAFLFGVVLYRNRSKSPSWHRRLRSQRAAARKQIGRCRGRAINWTRALSLAKALNRLCWHHSRPLYKIPSVVVKAYKQLYGGDPMTWGKWDNWSKSRRSPHQPRRDPKEMNKKEKDAVSKFPAYDSNAGGGSGSASSGSSVPAALAAPEVISLLKKLAGKDEAIAAEVEGYLPNPLKEDIREKQRTINMIRKLQQKVERKEQAIQRKEAQMAQFLEDLKQHISQEKTRHKAEMEQLRLELDEAKEALEKAKNGATGESAEMEEDLDKTLGLDDDVATENQALKLQLAAMEQEKQAQQIQLCNMQSQMNLFMERFADQIQAGGMTAPKNPMEEKLNHPPPGMGGMAPEIVNIASPIRTNATALQPFRVPKGGSQRSSPYGAESKQPRVEGQEAMNTME